jgi:hypothetical protein
MNKNEFESLNALYNTVVKSINDSGLGHEDVRAVLVRITVELFLKEYSIEQFITTMANVYQFEKNFTPELKEMH